MIHGRLTELNSLNSYYNNEENNMVVVYGRKNVGKTTIIKEFCRDREFFYYSCRQCSQREQENLFVSEICRNYGIQEKVSSFEEAFRSIDSNNTDKKIVVIDEFHYIVKSNPDFMNSLSQLIDGSIANSNVLVLLVTSSISWVENSMVAALKANAFYINGFLKVKEFNFVDMVKIIPKYSVKECIETYAVTGGVAGYLALWDTKKSVKENICKIFLNNNNLNLYIGENHVHEELREINVYNTILACLAAGNIKLNDVHNYTGFNRAKISVYLKNLMELEIVEKVFSADTEGKDNSKKGIYKIKDSSVHFWYKFIFPHMSEAQLLDDHVFYDKYIKPGFDEFVTESYVKVCREYILLLSKVKQIPINITKSTGWLGKTGDIDVLGMDESNNCVVGKCLWSGKKMTYENYDEFVKVVAAAKVTDNYYYLFSRSGFDTRLIEAANGIDTLELVDLSKM